MTYDGDAVSFAADVYEANARFRAAIQRAEAAEARVAELERERDEWRRMATEDDGTEARLAELEEITKAIQRESDENFARLHQATELLKQVLDEAEYADAHYEAERFLAALAGENAHETTHDA